MEDVCSQCPHITEFCRKIHKATGNVLYILANLCSVGHLLHRLCHAIVVDVANVHQNQHSFVRICFYLFPSRHTATDEHAVKFKEK